MSTKDKKAPPGIMGLFKKTKTAAQALVEVGSLATKREPPVLLLKDKPETKKQSPRLLKFSASASRLSRARVKTPERTTTRLAGPRKKVEPNVTSHLSGSGPPAKRAS